MHLHVLCGLLGAGAYQAFVECTLVCSTRAVQQQIHLSSVFLNTESVMLGSREKLSKIFQEATALVLSSFKFVFVKVYVRSLSLRKEQN